MAKKTYVQAIQEALDEAWQLLPDEATREAVTPALIKVLTLVKRFQADSIARFLDAESKNIQLKTRIRELLEEGDKIMESAVVSKLAYKLDITHDEALHMYNTLTEESDNPDDAFTVSAVRNAFMRQNEYNGI